MQKNALHFLSCGLTCISATDCLVNHCLIFNQLEKIMQKPTVGQKIKMPVYGKIRVVTVLAVHSFGTIDVETEMGNVLRITGLSFI